MIAAGIVQALIGIEAARRDLEDIAKPLSAEAAEGDERAEGEGEPEPERERPAAGARRRRRFGPSEAGLAYSPVQQYSSRVPDEDIDDEVAALAAALRDAGAEGMDRRTLGDRVECRLWGPGRYRHALSTAVERGAIRRTGRGRYAAEQEALPSGR